MPPPQDEFNRKLREAFAVEAEEHLQAITEGLLSLEKHPETIRPPEVIERIFREAHSLKGAARAVNRTDIEALCQPLEGVFMGWKRSVPTVSPQAFDVLSQTVNLLAHQLALEAPAESSRAKQQAREVIACLRALEAGSGQAEPRAPETSSPPPAPPATAQAPSSSPAVATASAAAPVAVLTAPETPEQERPHTADTVRVPVAKMSALLRKAEGMVAVKLSARRYAEDLRALGEMLETWRTEIGRTQRMPSRTESATAGDFSEWSQAYLQAVEDKVAALARGVQQDERVVAALVDDLLDDAKRLVMMPLSALLDAFPKQVRDLSRDQGKEVELVLRGREIELDKRILDELKDPLIHLVRNSVDHGLEDPAIRAAAGKPRTGVLTITASRLEGSKIALEVSDDGAGIDTAKVTAAAVRQGVITASDAGQLGPEAAQALIFQSGVSTSPIITEISGRGLGMAIVREKVEKLGGQISVRSQLGAGSSFRLTLPVTLATFKGILVSAGGQTFVAANSAVEQIARVRRDALCTIENRPALAFNGRLVSVSVLSELLGLPASPAAGAQEFMEVVVLSAAQTRVAFIVDEVLNEQEVLVKPLTRPLERVRNIASAALLGSGTPALILHVGDLLQSAVKAALPARLGAAAKTTPAEQRLLVADDSVTSRMLLKNILESAGFQVATAVDGLEAWTALQSGAFDLLVTDGEMPRMNGFELTSKVRGDRKLAELPVIVVTALGSREDRERGIDAGANAYIVKSTFDQSNLLEIIRKLIA